jgi:NCS1 family nucleobase:cation symporter-1
MFPRLNYRWICLAVTIPSVIFVYASSLQEIFNLLLIFVGLLVGPYWAIALVDYFFLRKQRIDVRACYDLHGVYRFTGGVNLAALGCMAVGMIVWLFLGGWLSGSSALTFAAGKTLFQYISATLPSMVVAGALYYAVARVLFARRPMGDYPFNRTAAVPEPARRAGLDPSPTP